MSEEMFLSIVDLAVSCSGGDTRRALIQAARSCAVDVAYEETRDIEDRVKRLAGSEARLAYLKSLAESKGVSI